MPGPARPADQRWRFVAAPIVGEALWVLQFVLLLPGSLLAVAITEGPLWNTGLSLQSLAILDLIASIGFNAVLWWFLLKLLDSVRKITAL